MPTISRAGALLVLFAIGLPAALWAQQHAASDSTRARRDTLEAVVVKALRSTLAPPAAQHTLTRDAIEERYGGQDAPLFLSSTPSMTSYSEAGGYSGYSYIRLRGIDQTRLNITVDGVPLNDPEDQVLYFSNVPDFLSSVQSVDIQRGVGTSTFGTASYAGSLNFQTIPLATTPRGGELQLGGGSFNTERGSAEYSTGIFGGGFAANGRLTAQHTDGYRYHSGNDSKSAFFSAGWFGNRDAFKFTGFAGISGTRMAYLAASEADLAVDRRTNPLTPAEGDRFHQEMASLQYTHVVNDAVRFTVTGYRNSAAGAFDVNMGNEIDNFFLAHVWYGAFTALSVRDGPLSLDVGAHMSDYHREHAMAVQPNLTDRSYTNVGYKQEQSGFAKLALDEGAVRFSADLQLRRAAFRYHPSANAGIGEQSIDWTFVNPKLGVTWRARTPLTLYATWGRNGREPARGDLFAGADDLNSGNAADILPLSRVRPERVDDYEAGAIWRSGPLSLTTNLFAMEFHDEIAAIGALSLTGNPLRKNVGSSYRRGIEFDATWRASDRVSNTANLTIMESRISDYFDAPSGNTYHNVEPLLTPPVVANDQADVKLTRSLSLLASGRYVGRSHLANDGNAQLVTPAYWMFDGGVVWRAGAVEIRAEVFNLLDAKADAAGYTDGTARYFYPIASRNLLLTSTIAF